MICSDTTVYTGPGDSGTIVNYVMPVSMDNCDSNLIPTLVNGLPSGSFFPLGLTHLTFETVDNSGNKSTCLMIVDVQTRVGIDNGQTAGRVFKLYPNPTTSEVFLELKYPSYVGKLRIEIFNVLGDKVMEKSVDMKDYYATTLDLGPFASGQYIVSIIFSDGMDSKQIMLLK
jgi:Secretion system C-terminal sorting domain/HYR domain